jgi:CRP-like cAMP-binding protein
LHALVQGGGAARRIKAGRFRHELALGKALHQALDRYLHIMLTQLATTAACTHFHLVSPRLARWLLMSAACAQADSFHLTHEFLARMLGVRREGVTHAACELQQRADPLSPQPSPRAGPAGPGGGRRPGQRSALT